MAERSPTERDIVDRHLRSAWQAVAPAPNLEERVRARLTSSTAATLGAVALGMASNSRPAGAWASLQASGKLGALVGAGLVGLGLISGYLIRDSRDDIAPPPLPVIQVNEAAARVVSPVELLPERGAAAPQEDVTEVHDEMSRTPPARVSRAARGAVSKAPPPRLGVPGAVLEPTRPSNELELLRRADRAVRADNAALALALIGELDAHSPRSTLLEERRAIELLAYCGVDATDASARAQRFLHEHPSSVYAGRIQEMCPVKSDLSTRAPR